MSKTKSAILTFLIVLVFILLGLVKDSNPDNQPKPKQGAKIEKASSSILCPKCLQIGCIYLEGHKLGLTDIQVEEIVVASFKLN